MLLQQAGQPAHLTLAQRPIAECDAAQKLAAAIIKHRLGVVEKRESGDMDAPEGPSGARVQSVSLPMDASGLRMSRIASTSPEEGGDQVRPHAGHAMTRKALQLNRSNSICRCVAVDEIRGAPQTRPSHAGCFVFRTKRNLFGDHAAWLTRA